MDPPPQSSSRNPSSLKHRFAKGFLRALTRIRKHGQSTNYNSLREIAQRRRRVKIAADAAMASAAGAGSVWSRAVLWRIRNRNCRDRRRPRSFGANLAAKVKRGGVKEIRKGKEDEVGNLGIIIGQEKRLRKVVPGGESMDICSLLEETADYIRCLTTQVKVMKRIAEISSAT